ncbi:MAG: hypothetical protein LLG02_01520 [Pelosinus sp.]|nr:hypothetical protein [Pelosinus sp.]
MFQDEAVFSAPFKYTLSVIGEKCKMSIMFWLSKRKIMRYGELKKSMHKLGSVSRQQSRRSRTARWSNANASNWEAIGVRYERVVGYLLAAAFLNNFRGD